MGNTAQHCRLGLCQDSDYGGDLEDSKSTSGGIQCIFGSQTIVPISRMCKNRTSVFHSSTEAEIISLDAGLSMDGIPALDLWRFYLVIAVSHCNQNQPSKNQGFISTGKLVAQRHVEHTKEESNQSSNQAR